MFGEREFQTLRDELEYLGSSAVRLSSVEKLWVVAAQQREIDRRIRQEFGMSERDLDVMKDKLKAMRRKEREGSEEEEKEVGDGGEGDDEEGVEGVLVSDFLPGLRAAWNGWDSREELRRLGGWRSDDIGSNKMSNTSSASPSSPSSPSASSSSGGNAVRGEKGGQSKKFAADADKVEADYSVDERLRYFLFGDAVEEKIKLVLLYLPAAMAAIVAASVLTMLFALLDGEMVVSITSMGRIRLGILSYLVVVGTVWFTNTVTPMILGYLDLGKPVLLKAKCPNCKHPISCLFTSSLGRVRDERKCKSCGAVVGFNSRWSKVYLIAPPHHDRFLAPD